MSESIKVQARISTEAHRLLDLATTRYKRGEFIDKLILQFVDEDGAVRNCSDGVLERIEKRLGRIEKLLAQECQN